jgi:hypothetical protein
VSHQSTLFIPRLTFSILFQIANENRSQIKLFQSELANKTGQFRETISDVERSQHNQLDSFNEHMLHCNDASETLVSKISEKVQRMHQLRRNVWQSIRPLIQEHSSHISDEVSFLGTFLCIHENCTSLI